MNWRLTAIGVLVLLVLGVAVGALRAGTSDEPAAAFVDRSRIRARKLPAFVGSEAHGSDRRRAAGRSSWPLSPCRVPSLDDMS